jgi:hypothetical protein
MVLCEKIPQNPRRETALLAVKNESIVLTHAALVFYIFLTNKYI